MDARQVSGDQNIATEDQYQQIDEEISRLYASIAALKSRRNALSPLYRLPPEIITTIFLCVKRAYRRSNFLDHFSPFKWISLTHVSSHLRSIAINAPCLWVDPPLDNLPWMEEMLKRSKNAGLIVNARLSSKGNPPGLEQVLQHSAHIKVLRFDILSPDHYTQMLQYLPRSAPQLAYLAINAPYFGPGHFQTIQPFFVSIPSNILLETPRLRYLELTSCKFNWNTHSHLFHSLAHLRIYYLPQTSRPTPKQMVDVLKAMPNIISLCLSHALPTEANNRVSWTSGPIHLASLRRLEIQDTTTGLEDFFSCVTFPLTATMQVNILFISNNDNAGTSNRTRFSALIAGIARSYTDDQFYFQKIMIEEEVYPDIFKITLYPKISANGHMPSSLYSQLELRFRGFVGTRLELLGPSDVRGILNDVLRGGLPLRYVKQVYMPHHITGLDMETIATTFGTLPQVDFVTAGEDSGKLLLEALKYSGNTVVTGPAVSDTGNTILTFPHLSSICFRQTFFSTEPLPYPACASIEALEAVLVYRRDAGMKIQQLSFKRCLGLLQQNVDRIFQFVEKVDWDGYEIADYDEVDDNEDPYSQYSEEEHSLSDGYDSDAYFD